ncbi:MAG: class II aldolase/adducin family protein [Gammaproteobacteria bacterium]|nr:class II aldolase/adducin family protein [Gammaproteobacteria bacterium]NNC96793.1 class II aldolase/adducin family protein [Gammaproteobacteria bacterium]NNM13405.1 class II aldolase/adducin family protein [Gammaproteobacteria bacterium]
MQTEQELRVQLAAMYRIFDHLGWSEMIYNHITVKIPGDEEHFLINPYGLHYSEVKASNLVKVDIKGNVVEDSAYKANPAGMVIHSAIHAHREDAHCITHIHTTDGMAVACQEGGLRHDNFYSVLLYNQVAYHDFEGLTVNMDEQQRMVASLGDKPQLILRNHGLLSIGRSIPEAFINTWVLQRACEVQVATDSTGRANIPIAEEIGKKSEELLKIQMSGMNPGELEFAAFVRKIDAIDPSYKD